MSTSKIFSYSKILSVIAMSAALSACATGPRVDLIERIQAGDKDFRVSATDTGYIISTRSYAPSQAGRAQARAATLRYIRNYPCTNGGVAKESSTFAYGSGRHSMHFHCKP